MLIFKTPLELADYLAVQPDSDIGLVPTMGALHEGHGSLVQKSVHAHRLTICTIYVNPLQFTNFLDLQKYPRTPQADIERLQTWGCNIVWMPELELDLSSCQAWTDLGFLDTVMEGADRPGHFTGVCRIIEYLFKLIKPKKAYFGLKDYQQVAVVRQLIHTLKLPVELMACPIVREASGLAMSSRNSRLKPERRQHAAHMYRCMQNTCQMLEKHGYSKSIELLKHDLSALDFEVHYAEFREAHSLNPLPVNRSLSNTVLLLACSLDGVRLIDNLECKGF
mgnify:CR=1 FL=1